MKKFLSVISIVALMVCTFVVTASATNYPYREHSAYPYQIHATYDGQYYCYSFDDSASEAYFEFNGHQVVIKPTKAVNYDTWKYNSDTDSWDYISSGSASANDVVSIVNIGWDVYQSDVNIYDSNGDLFFPLPPSLSEVVQEVTEEQGTQVAAQAVGVMKILVPCGVGCLALLMAFPVLRKGFLRFLH